MNLPENLRIFGMLPEQTVRLLYGIIILAIILTIVALIYFSLRLSEKTRERVRDENRLKMDAMRKEALGQAEAANIKVSVSIEREAREELSIDGEFLHSGPVFLTTSKTVGKTAGHTDVSLWYTLRGNRHDDIVYDQSEFQAVSWFHRQEVPLHRCDIHLERFLKKLYGE